uniref:VPS10 domain-containing protein n=1 Tax=Mucochytrium quahogii TaxID=96639 RepID=A0A7S2SMF3_9STRA|mmetsp:Transcript_8325/g.18177  ORF Transcript_8325/g.18177 Transcript_8325/m.18177 type:complete len:799 (+) Transcript_8325:596-2992(+)
MQKNVVVLVSRGTYHYVSKDGGQSFTSFRTTFSVDKLVLHPYNPSMMLASSYSKSCKDQKKLNLGVDNVLDNGKDSKGQLSCYKSLYISYDMGQTFQLGKKYVHQFDFAARLGLGDELSSRLDNRILATHSTVKHGDQREGFWDPMIDLVVSADSFNGEKLLVKGGNRFLFAQNKLFTAQVVNTVGIEIVLQLSSDNLASFYTGALPFKLREHSYTVLDTSEGVVFLHVNHGKDDSGWGNIYISDSTGMNYTFSLKDNVRDTNGKCDFDRVVSIEGVYISNFIDNVKELEEAKKHTGRKIKPVRKIRSVVTYDRGGEWSLLRAPGIDAFGKPISCSSSKCSLHLHGQSTEFAPVYSSEKAIGIVLGSGNVGPYLSEKPGDVNTYMSHDGGMSWLEVRKGSNTYEIGDHGGLVVMADNLKMTNKLVYTWDQGHTWTEIEFTKQPMDVDNIIIEPTSTSTVFHVYGTRLNSAGGRVGVLNTVDFSGLHERECTGAATPMNPESDYEVWSPRETHRSGGGFGASCHLGHQTEYVRRKQKAVCYNAERFESQTVVENCKCTEHDYECDFGYIKVGSKCQRDLAVANESLAPPTTCPTSGYYTVSNGYRKVGGNTCEGGTDLGPTTFQCSRGVFGISVGGWFVLIVLLALLGVMAYSNKGSPTGKKLMDGFGTANFGEETAASCWDLVKDVVRNRGSSRLFSGGNGGGYGGVPQSAMDFESGDFGDDDFVDHGNEFEFADDLGEDDDLEENDDASLIEATTIAKPLPPAPAQAHKPVVPTLDFPSAGASKDPIKVDMDFGDAI